MHPVGIFAENQLSRRLRERSFRCSNYSHLLANDTINGVSTMDSLIRKPICRGVIYDTHWSPKAYKNEIKDKGLGEGFETVYLHGIELRIRIFHLSFNASECFVRQSYSKHTVPTTINNTKMPKTQKARL